MKYKTTNLLRLADVVRQKIQKKKLFNSSQDLLITFSGGQDSVFCLLILDLLRNRKIFTWNCKKVTNFFKQSQTEKELIKQKLVYEKAKLLWNQNKVLIDKRFSEYKVFTEQEKKNTYDYLNNTFGNNYTLLWCNHFWQKDSFFTMEHVSKLAFCKNYVIQLFVPIEKLLSEQNARNWRHKVTQRSSLFLCKKRDYQNCIGLYYTFVLITKPLFFISTKSETTLSQPILKSTTRNSTPWPELLCVQGHNKSDRAEAVLFNLIKGTGMNGLSTLQWKQTFLFSSNSNNTFYPILSDFSKEIQIFCLNSFSRESFRQKATKRSKEVRLNIFVPKQRFGKPKRPLLQLRYQNQVVAKAKLERCGCINESLCMRTKTSFWLGTHPKLGFDTVTGMHHTKTFYYQLQYKIRKIL